MRQPRKVIPAPALKALARRYHRKYARDENVLSVGIGFKRSRRAKLRHGFGALTRPCLTAVVRRKLPPSRLGKFRPFPKTVSIVYRGRRYTVVTDVVELGRPILHQHQCTAGQQIPDSACYRIGMPGNEGSCGFVLRSGSGRLLLVTAGHVLNDSWADLDAGAIWGLLDSGQQTLNGEQCWMPSVAAGPVRLRLYQSPDDGLCYDIGVIELDAAALRSFDAPPWNLMQRIVSVDTLVRGFTHAQLEAVKLTAYGLYDTPSVVLKDVLTNAMPFDGLGTYAPTLLYSLTTQGIYDHGDSGAPLLDDTGALYGLHVVGFDQDGTQGYAIAADSVRAFLQQMIGEPLDLYPFAAPAGV